VTPDPTDPALAVDEPPAGGPPGVDATPEPSEQPGPPPAPPSSHGRWLREGVIVVVVAVLVAVLLRAFVVQTFYIPSGSMEPTLQIGDRILVNKLSYHLHGVDRGNIVVFSRPPTESCGGPEVNDLVKRVIGMPGDVLTLSGGYVYVDGKRLDETWLPSTEQGVTSAGPEGSNWNLSRPYRVPANDYFVMGDNRTDSCDSRYWGPIAKSLIVGKVEVRVWPLSSLRLF
jgi:signal peptidase I